MLPPHNSPVTIVAVCGILWFIIWSSARDTTIRNWAIGIAALYALLGACGVVVMYAEHAQNERWCSVGSSLCEHTQIEWRSWVPIVISVAVVGYVAFRMNTRNAKLWSEKVLEDGAQVPSLVYIVARIMSIQWVIIGFIGMSALFWTSDPDSGQSLLAILLLFFLLGALLPIPMLWLVLRVNQLGKYQKAWGLAYAIAPAISVIALLSNQNYAHLFNVLRRPGGDSRYLAMVIIFGSVSVYAAFGEVLSGKLHANLESLDYLTAPWIGKAQIDPGPTLGELRRIKRSAHVVWVIMSGTAIGSVPPGFHLPDVLGMIIGVGFVALISYLDAELASRHLD